MSLLFNLYFTHFLNVRNIYLFPYELISLNTLETTNSLHYSFFFGFPIFYKWTFFKGVFLLKIIFILFNL